MRVRGKHTVFRVESEVLKIEKKYEKSECAS